MILQHAVAIIRIAPPLLKIPLLVKLMYKGRLDHFGLLARRCSSCAQCCPSTPVCDIGAFVLTSGMVCALRFHLGAALCRRRHNCRRWRCCLHSLGLRVLSYRRSRCGREYRDMARRSIAGIPRERTSRKALNDSTHGRISLGVALWLLELKLGNSGYMW